MTNLFTKVFIDMSGQSGANIMMKDKFRLIFNLQIQKKKNKKKFYQTKLQAKQNKFPESLTLPCPLLIANNCKDRHYSALAFLSCSSLRCGMIQHVFTFASQCLSKAGKHSFATLIISSRSLRFLKFDRTSLRERKCTADTTQTLPIIWTLIENSITSSPCCNHL